MAPSEAAILENYLLLPARLTDILTLEQFRAMFPRQQQSSPQIKTLYRDLQRQRAALVDHVQANIDEEVKAGREMRRRIARARTAEQLEADANADEEIEIERALFGDQSGAAARPHTLSTIVPALENAAGAVEAQIARLEKEEERLMEQVQLAISGLSDLRYGKLENNALGEEVLQSLEMFQETCRNKS